MNHQPNHGGASFLLNLETAVEQVIASDPMRLALLRRFSKVELIDTTIIRLPDELLQVWAGCGGTLGASSSLKVELGMELITGTSSGPHLHAGRTHDPRGKLGADHPETG
jgi:hypothetical protein